MSQPQGIALRTLPPLLYGTGYPYGTPFTGSGSPEAVRGFTRDQIVAAHDAWIRPDTAQIFVVGDTTLAEIVPMLEARFGNWRAPSVARGTKSFATAIPDPRPRIILVDRPQSPQSLILGGAVLGVNGTDDLLDLTAANDVLGGVHARSVFDPISGNNNIMLEMAELRGKVQRYLNIYNRKGGSLRDAIMTEREDALHKNLIAA